MADKKLTQLDEITSVTPEDIIYIVDSPGGTPASKKLTARNFWTLPIGLDVLSDDTYYGIGLVGRNAGYASAVGDPLFMSRTSSFWRHADASSGMLFPARAICCTAANSGDPVVAMVLGTMRNDSWSWTDSASTLYLGNSGTIVETLPTSAGSCIQVVGFALSDDEAFFNFTGNYAEHS